MTQKTRRIFTDEQKAEAVRILNHTPRGMGSEAVTECKVARKTLTQ
jgi:hypothetical protein